MAQKHVWMHPKLENGEPNPDHVPNWENGTLPETVHVLYAGQVHPTTNGIHLSRMLRDGGQIVEAPAGAVSAETREEPPIAPALKGVPDVEIVPHPKREAKKE